MDVGIVGAVVDLAGGVVHLHLVESGGDDAEGIRAIAEHSLPGRKFIQIILKRDPPHKTAHCSPVVIEYQEAAQRPVPVPMAQEIGVNKQEDHRRGDENHRPLPDPAGPGTQGISGYSRGRFRRLSRYLGRSRRSRKRRRAPAGRSPLPVNSIPRRGPNPEDGR